MCGLAGFWDFKQTHSKAELLSIAQSMAEAIRERGPDASGEWVEENSGVALSHRRLSIVDLSDAGAQPMSSQSGRYIIAYNGEVYNAAELRKELVSAGCKFRGHSDTEVIIEACEQWGIQEACCRFLGMFAFALWDREERRLYLVRDRLGIKPLYFGLNGHILFFGSQIKSFKKHPRFKAKLDQQALSEYFRFNYIPAPLSIFEGIKKIIPGVIVSINQAGTIEENPYWDFEKIVEQKIATRKKTSDNELIEELDCLLRDSVKKRMISDVPLGAFLSGGIDSSTVVALMQAQSEKPVKTFSIGFFEKGFDEAKHAALVAAHLGTDHHELYLKDKDAQTFIPDIPKFFDEPFADVSQIPTYLVSKMAREKVTVSLSGDGGDELFGGYNRYLTGYNIWRWIQWMPESVKKMGALGIQAVPAKFWDALEATIPSRWSPPLLGDKANKFANVMQMKSAKHFYRTLVSSWQQPEKLVLGAQEASLYPWSGCRSVSFENFIEQMQFLDTLTYLPNDILTKVDRASMAVSLEARVPLLDHRVVEFAWGLPLNLKVRQGKGKWILRQVLDRYVPRELIERPKMGFGVPIGQWLQGELKEWASDLLSPELLKNQGLFNHEWVGKHWQEHLTSQRNWQYQLWSMLMFQSWYLEQGEMSG